MSMFIKGRFDELRREVMVGYEASERGELIDGEVVFENLREKLAQHWRYRVIAPNSLTQVRYLG
jgi:hypothetical protein